MGVADPAEVVGDAPPVIPIRPPPDDTGPPESPPETSAPPGPFAEPVAPPPTPDEPHPCPDPAPPVRWGPFVLVGITYVMMLTTLLVVAAAAWVQAGRFTALTKPDEKRGRLMDFAVLGGVDAALLFVALLAIAPPPRVATPSRWRRAGVWAVAAPVFALLLGMNVGYHLALRELFQVKSVDIGIGWADGWLAVLLVCVQPAVVEELMFRHLMLGHMRPLIGTHPAVWVTAALFGAAHVGAWISLPILGLLGAGLGYARVYTGGLALPVVLHFLHNLVVTYLNHALGY
jgi:membrane protease YdiL (CAAX protease family)